MFFFHCFLRVCVCVCVCVLCIGYSFEETATTIQTHAICMFAPGLFSGEIIRCLGEPAVMLVGCILMIVLSAVALVSKQFCLTTF